MEPACAVVAARRPAVSVVKIRDLFILAGNIRCLQLHCLVNLLTQRWWLRKRTGERVSTHMVRALWLVLVWSVGLGLGCGDAEVSLPGWQEGLRDGSREIASLTFE